MGISTSGNRWKRQVRRKDFVRLHDDWNVFRNKLHVMGEKMKSVQRERERAQCIYGGMKNKQLSGTGTCTNPRGSSTVLTPGALCDLLQEPLDVSRGDLLLVESDVDVRRLIYRAEDGGRGEVADGVAELDLFVVVVEQEAGPLPAVELEDLLHRLADELVRAHHPCDHLESVRLVLERVRLGPRGQDGYAPDGGVSRDRRDDVVANGTEKGI